MDYNTFVALVKQKHVTCLLQETTKYKNLGELSQLYAEDRFGKLIGSYSKASGGVIFKKPPIRWTKSGRTFNKLPI